MEYPPLVRTVWPILSVRDALLTGPRRHNQNGEVVASASPEISPCAGRVIEGVRLRFRAAGHSARVLGSIHFADGSAMIPCGVQKP
jgi:hypothetical protein